MFLETNGGKSPIFRVFDRVRQLVQENPDKFQYRYMADKVGVLAWIRTNLNVAGQPKMELFISEQLTWGDKNFDEGFSLTTLAAQDLTDSLGYAATLQTGEKAKNQLSTWQAIHKSWGLKHPERVLGNFLTLESNEVVEAKDAYTETNLSTLEALALLDIAQPELPANDARFTNLLIALQKWGGWEGLRRTILGND